MSEPNIVCLDWSRIVVDTVNNTNQEIIGLIKEAGYDPKLLLSHPKLLAERDTEIFDETYWIRNCRGLIELHRKRSDGSHLELLSQFNKLLAEHMRARRSPDVILIDDNGYQQWLELFCNNITSDMLKMLAKKNFIAATLNMLDHPGIDELVELLSNNSLNIARFNLSNIMDNYISNPEKLKIIVENLSNLNKATNKDTMLLASSINEFSICLKYSDALGIFQKLHQEIIHIQNMVDDEQGSNMLEELSSDYINALKKHSTVVTSKKTFEM